MILFQGGKFHVRGRTGNDNSGILACNEDSNEIQNDNVREGPEGNAKDTGIIMIAIIDNHNSLIDMLILELICNISVFLQVLFNNLRHHSIHEI